MVGIDIVEVDRIDYSDSFMNKIALDCEIEYIKKSNCIALRRQRLTALFCVKEAVMKALGTGASEGITFKDICLKHEKNGKPFVELKGKAFVRFTEMFSGKSIEISISHTQNYATAIAVIV